MADRQIQTQRLRVGYTAKNLDVEGILRYEPDAPDILVTKPVRGWVRVRSIIGRIREQATELTYCAVFGRGRGERDLMPFARDLAAEILPQEGFGSVLREGAHPQFDIALDYACEIPWEVLEEKYAVCPTCRERFMWSSDRKFCPKDGMPLAYESHKLALDYHLTHMVRGKGERGRGGKEFWMVVDPLNDLRREKECAEHIGILRHRLQEAGYAVQEVETRNVTRSRFLDIIHRDNCAGLYYFGHAYYPKDGREGFLILAENERLFANEIEEAKPAAKFIFLNACEAGAAPCDWDLDNKRSGSVAHAFAVGDGKVVIAPLWPIPNTQAAQMAVLFFSKVSQTTTLAEALAEVRKASVQEYERGQAHIAWMAYRYFGAPNSYMPIPAAGGVSTPVVVGPSRVFDEDGRLNTDLFECDIDGILGCAASCRDSSQANPLTVGDFITGLVRQGDLTRFVLERLGKDPDVLGGAAGGTRPPNEAAVRGDSQVNPPVRQEPAHDRVQFDPPLALLLEEMDRHAQESSGGQNSGVSERTILEVLSDSVPWASREDLPAKDVVQRELSQCSLGELIDANGHLLLHDLNECARGVIETAHVLAQQKGESEITRRLMLAALVMDKDSHAAKAFRTAKVDPEMVFSGMIYLTEDKPARSFGLSPKACTRVVLPMLEKARGIAEDKTRITEADLFTGFCQAVPDEFKRLINSLFDTDLDLLSSGKPVPRHNAEPVQSFETLDGKGTIEASRFDEQAWGVMLEAERLCCLQGGAVIRSPHLFAALLDRMGERATTGFSPTRLDCRQLKSLVLSLVPRAPSGAANKTAERPKLSSNAYEILVRAVKLAESSGRSRATVEDIQAVFPQEGKGIIDELFRRLHDYPFDTVVVERQGQPEKASRVSLLSELGRDLTERARTGKSAAIVGRDREIETVLQTLLLAESPNPLLIGEAGVGKTAIVEGLAQRLIKGNCPKKLQDTAVIELSVGSLVANTSLRGQFEQKIQMLLQEAGARNVIVFIDEIHSLLGAGATGDSLLDAGNMLKSALARGDIRAIGATTPSEFRRTIAKDKALSRRFHPVIIEPPSREATIEILNAQQTVLESNHEVRISPQAVTAAVDLSGYYLVNERWPAKARDILDRACAIALTAMSPMTGEVTVRAEDVARAISMRTGIPFEKVAISSMALLDGLEERITRRIIGQDDAVRAVVNIMRTSHLGLNGRDRPRGVLLFVGPSGVGKTELAKVMAEEVFGGTEGLIRFDMGDFTEPHSVAKLLGAPPSYVGYGTGSPLVERLRKRPHSLLLLDEIEHAHEDVLAALLRLLSEGMIEDVDGNIGDARNALIIMTTNIGNSQQGNGIGFVSKTETDPSQTQTSLRQRLESVLPRKLLDRIDQIVAFHTFSQEDMARIAGYQVDQLIAQIRSSTGTVVSVAADIPGWLARQVAQEHTGARGTQRAVSVHVGNPLFKLLNDQLPHGVAAVEVYLDGDAVKVKVVGPQG